jgi:hypothetical protein
MLYKCAAIRGIVCIYADDLGQCLGVEPSSEVKICWQVLTGIPQVVEACDPPGMSFSVDRRVETVLESATIAMELHGLKSTTSHSLVLSLSATTAQTN